MKIFNNGVPMLSVAAKSFVTELVRQGASMKAGTVALTINPKNHNRSKKLKVIEVAFAGGEIYLWYKGYHYRYVLNKDWVPLNLRNHRIIRFYKQLHSFRKKGCKNVTRRIRM